MDVDGPKVAEPRPALRKGFMKFAQIERGFIFPRAILSCDSRIWLPAEQVNGRERSERSEDLQCDDRQGVLGTLRQPSNREEQYYRDLRSHQ